MALNGWRKYFPHERIISDDEISGDEASFEEQKASLVETTRSVTVSTDGGELHASLPYELRDEAGRKWWKFFDEFEYRANKEYKLSLIHI